MLAEFREYHGSDDESFLMDNFASYLFRAFEVDPQFKMPRNQRFTYLFGLFRAAGAVEQELALHASYLVLVFEDDDVIN